MGIEDIIRRRVGKRRIGFSTEPVSDETKAEQNATLLAQVTPEDVLAFGLIPELVGRLPIITPLMPLSREALVQILTEPRNAIVKQYQHMFSLEGATLDFTDEALNLLAERAMKRETGARALRAVIDEYMLDLMYELPESNSEGVSYLIDRDAIEAGYSLAELPQRKKKHSA